jgi:hypothetical protein
VFRYAFTVRVVASRDIAFDLLELPAAWQLTIWHTPSSASAQSLPSLPNILLAPRNVEHVVGCPVTSAFTQHGAIVG